MFIWIFKRIYSYCCIKQSAISENNKDLIFNTIKANIRNFEPLTNIEREYILNFTTNEQKSELIFLYDMCVKAVIIDMLYIINAEENNTRDQQGELSSI